MWWSCLYRIWCVVSHWSISEDNEKGRKGNGTVLTRCVLHSQFSSLVEEKYVMSWDFRPSDRKLKFPENLLERIWIYLKFFKHWSIKKVNTGIIYALVFWNADGWEWWLHVSASLFSGQNVLVVHWIGRWMSLLSNLRAAAKTWYYVTAWIPVSKFIDSAFWTILPSRNT